LISPASTPLISWRSCRASPSAARSIFPAVHVEGIRHISALDIEFAAELDFHIKLLGSPSHRAMASNSAVHACMVAASDADRTCRRRLQRGGREGDFRRPCPPARPRRRCRADRLFGGRRLLDIAAGGTPRPSRCRRPRCRRFQLRRCCITRAPYYIRLMVFDRPGVIADITAALRDELVSLDNRMIQRGRAPGPKRCPSY